MNKVQLIIHSYLLIAYMIDTIESSSCHKTMSDNEARIRTSDYQLLAQEKHKKRNVDAAKDQNNIPMRPIQLKHNNSLTSNEELLLNDFYRFILQGANKKVLDILENPQKFSHQYNLDYTAEDLCKASDRWGRTCLHAALLTIEDTTLITEACIVHGADINAQDLQTNRPCNFLINPKSIKILIQHEDIILKTKEINNSLGIYDSNGSKMEGDNLQFFTRVQQSKDLIRQAAQKKYGNLHQASQKKYKSCSIS